MQNHMVTLTVIVFKCTVRTAQ